MVHSKIQCILSNVDLHKYTLEFERNTYPIFIPIFLKFMENTTGERYIFIVLSEETQIHLKLGCLH